MLRSDLTTSPSNKHIKLIETTYQNNTHSDYTEKIETLCKNFKYTHNNHDYWTDPEQSMLYGTPIYESASHAQKIALNHIHWFAMYNFVAASETEIVVYNQITADVFKACGYDTLAHELALETSQERTHIHTFHKIGYLTMKALLGQDAFKVPLKGKLYQLAAHNSSEKSQWQLFQNNILRFTATTMLGRHKQYYSPHLKQLEATHKLIPVSNTGFFGQGMLSKSVHRFVMLNWGISPFLASQYYTLRMMANILLKNTEYKISKHFKNLHSQGKSIPDPTAVSHYHFLDESFHTTTSLVSARDLYKQLPAPTAYEKLIGNLTVYMMQVANLSGISAISPDSYRADDCTSIYFIYRILQSPLFGMSSQDALHWLEKSLCEEHEGFHVSAKYYENLRLEMTKFLADLDYLWPINHQVEVMKKESINQAIQRNIKTFQEFSKLVNSDN